MIQILLVRVECEERVEPMVREGGGLKEALHKVDLLVELALLGSGAWGLMLSIQVEIGSCSAFLFLEGGTGLSLLLMI